MQPKKAAPSKKASVKKAVKAAEVNIGLGVRVTVEGDDLVIRINGSNDFGLSHSAQLKGRVNGNHVIATTSGNKPVQLPNGKVAILGLNLYSNQIG
jgi:hypothetical protein